MIKTILAISFGLILFSGGLAHLIKPKIYRRMIPKVFPEAFANISAFIAEVGISILLFIPEYRQTGALAFVILMVLFLPLHIWDVIRERPVVGSKKVAWIRLVIQFGLIYGGWVLV